MKFKILLSLMLVFVLFFVGCTAEKNESKVLIGYQSTPASALVQIADEKGFFAENGLNVELKEFTAGKFAFQALLAGSVDAAVVGDLPLALAKLQGNDFYALTEVGENESEDPVVVRDDGSKTPQEYFLKSKRKLSTSIGGTPEYYTYLFLKYFEIPSDKVEIVSQKPEEMVGALSSNSVDAIAIFEPYPTIAEQVLQGKTKRFLLPSGIYPTAYVLTGNKNWVDKNPEKAKLLIKALIKAEQFAKSNPAEAQQIVSKRTKFSKEIIEKIWKDFDLRVRISDSLVENWKNQAKWAIETGKSKPVAIPDFSQILRKDLLDSAKAS